MRFRTLLSRAPKSLQANNVRISEVVNVEDVRAQLWQSRLENTKGGWFVPTAAIKRILDESTIESLLEQYHHNVELNHQKRHIIDLVISSYSNTLAVLVYLHDVALITDFVAAPHTLPVGREYLDFRKLTSDRIERFLENQYHFLEIDLRIGTVLPTVYDDDRLILPICSHGTESSGAFGVVQEVSIHNESIPQGSRYVAKRFRPDVTQSEYLRELRNLSILSTAKHPHIVPLLSAYTHCGEHNLIFPRAAGGDLSDILDGRSDGRHFDRSIRDTQFLYELCGLASGLSTLHVLKTDILDVIGVHRDLKPSNILVDGRTMMLADFGVSKLVEANQTSSSIMPQTRGDFIAPECEDVFDESIPRQRAGRASDVWAFACILLTITTMRLEGFDGVKKFHRDRRTDYEGIIRHRFHIQNALLPAVESRLRLLEESELDRKLSARLSLLLRAMLSLNPLERPNMAYISKCLQRLYLLSESNVVVQKFERQHDAKGLIHIYTDLKRFQSWMIAMGIHDSQKELLTDTTPELSFDNFTDISSRVMSISHILDKEEAESKDKIDRIPLNNGIHVLLSSLDTEQFRKARDFFEQELLKYRGDKHLEALAFDAKERQDVDMSRLVLLKRGYLSRELRTQDQEDDIVSLDSLTWSNRQGQIFQVERREATTSRVELGIAEERPTPVDQDRLVATQKFHDGVQRLLKVAQLLAIADEMESMRILPCFATGVFQDESSLRSGLVYSFPRENNQQFRGFSTLLDILGGNVACRLKLGQRFAIAYTLARSIYELHKVSWLHRRVCASNVICFHRMDHDSPSIDAKNVYFVGFAQSRSEKNPLVTEGNKTSEDSTYYLHPAYHAGNEDFQVAFDYYSLGVLLLELGFSHLLPELCKLRGLDLAQVVREDIENAGTIIEDLQYTMGQSYYSAVKACLDGSLTKSDKFSAPKIDIERKFKEKVLDLLEHCSLLDM